MRFELSAFGISLGCASALCALMSACEPSVAAVLPPEKTDLAGSTYAETIQSTNGLVAYFRFSEQGASTTVDRIGGYRMSADPGAVLESDGAIPSDPEPGAVTLHATQAARLTMPFPEGFRDLTRALTLELWLRPRGVLKDGKCVQPSAPAARIVWVQGSLLPPDDCAWGLLTSGNDTDALTFSLQVDTGQDPYQMGRLTTASGTLRVANGSECGAGIFQHVAATFDAAIPAPQMKIYVDGKPAEPANPSLRGAVDVISPAGGIAGFDVDLAFNLGGSGAAQDDNAPALGAPFDGDIDELAVYSRALSAAEIAAHAAFGMR